MKKMNKLIIISVSIILGIIFLVGGYVYITTPANMLPHFLPGYSAALTKHHVTHAIGCFLLGIACFVFAWFQSGKKSKA